MTVTRVFTGQRLRKPKILISTESVRLESERADQRGWDKTQKNLQNEGVFINSKRSA